MKIGAIVLMLGASGNNVSGKNGALRFTTYLDGKSLTNAWSCCRLLWTHEWETLETRTFVWDGNTIVLEKIEFADGTARTFEYFWGADKSGSEQGAGGVGGLLAVSVDGAFYFPCYDHNGNIVLYVSETGGVAATRTTTATS